MARQPVPAGQPQTGRPVTLADAADAARTGDAALIALLTTGALVVAAYLWGRRK